MTVWLWVAVALAIGGAVLLFPIGRPLANTVFILVKLGMVGGLLAAIRTGKKTGLTVWTAFSAGAVVMTLIKWALGGTAFGLYLVSICVDVMMPLCAWLILRREEQLEDRGKKSD